MNETPLYPYSAKEARARGELAQWRESFRANCACAGMVEIAIRESFDGMHLKDGAVEQVVDWFGQKPNRKPAQRLRFGEDEQRNGRDLPLAAGRGIWSLRGRNASFVVHSHPAVLDGFIREYRKQVQSLGLFEKQHCEPVSDLKKSNRKPAKRLRFEEDEQRNERDLPLAAGRGIWSLRGRGCSPNARGRSVFCVSLGDGEQTRWNRNEFVGILKDEFLPDWARENLRQYLPEQTEHREMELAL